VHKIVEFAGGIVNTKSSRREFLQTGLALPATVLISSYKPEAISQAPGIASYRLLGKTGLKVSAVGPGVGITPDPKVIARAIDLGVNYSDTARGYGEGNSERITCDYHQACERFMFLPEKIRSVCCSDCSSCAIHCHNGVDVQNRLIRAQELLT
jgi:predicted aldo/keto reductase-like oxidoreductase